MNEKKSHLKAIGACTVLDTIYCDIMFHVTITGHGSLFLE